MKERDAARTSPMTPGFYGEWPSSVVLYYSSPGKDFLSQRFMLCEEASGTEPRRDLYAVTFHKGPGLLQMTLYSHETTPMGQYRALMPFLNHLLYPSRPYVTFTNHVLTPE